jgi:hypothetical protein
MGRITFYPFESDWDDIKRDYGSIGLIQHGDVKRIIIETQLIEPHVREFIHKYQFYGVKMVGIDLPNNICIHADTVQLTRCISHGICSIVADDCDFVMCAGNYNVIANYMSVSCDSPVIRGLVGIIRHTNWTWDTIAKYRDDIPTAHIFIVCGVISPETREFGDTLGVTFAYNDYKRVIRDRTIDLCKALMVLHDLL